jgi:hypothetical protein
MDDSASITGDLTALRDRFPGWEFEAKWTVAGTGPDSRYLLARKGDATYSAWSADDLAAQVTAAVIAAALNGNGDAE